MTADATMRTAQPKLRKSFVNWQEPFGSKIALAMPRLILEGGTLGYPVRVNKSRSVLVTGVWGCLRWCCSILGV
jgi:hypothetical protein